MVHCRRPAVLPDNVTGVQSTAVPDAVGVTRTTFVYAKHGVQLEGWARHQEFTSDEEASAHFELERPQRPIAEGGDGPVKWARSHAGLWVLKRSSVDYYVLYWQEVAPATEKVYARVVETFVEETVRASVGR